MIFRRRQQVLTALLAFAAAPLAADERTVIPFEFLGTMPLVIVRIGEAAVRLQFDLGDQSTLVLRKDVLGRVKGVPIGTSGRLMAAKGNPVTSPDYRLKDVRIGAEAFPEVIARLEVHDPTYRATDLGQDGFLGTGLLKPFLVRLDYAQKTISLIRNANPDEPPDDCVGDVLPFVAQWHGEAVTEVHTDLGRAVLWWDTGAPMMVLSRRFVDEARPGPAMDELVSERFVIGARDFGATRLHVWDINLPEGFHGFIGKDFFDTHVVCVDYPGKRLLVPR